MDSHRNSNHPEGIRTRIEIVTLLAIVAACIGAAALTYRALTHAGHATQPPYVPSQWGIGLLPFIGILLAIAILPILQRTHRWWDNNRNRLVVSIVFAGLTLLYYAIARSPARVADVLEHAVVDEYIPFMMLLFGLYFVSGGISVRGDLPAHPMTNTIFLAIGGVAANLVGTTGASMVLIRPLLQTNSERTRVTHTVVFFIFIVSNVGGCLLPIGDPPLFLGYLRGVPFLWTLVLWKEWMFCTIALLVIYFIWDSIAYKREPISSILRDEATRQPLRMRGAINLLWLALLMLAVALLNHHRTFPGTNWTPFRFLRELVVLGLVGLSLLTTPRGVRRENSFNYAPLLEVAALFIGIFITMQVPIEVLDAKGAQLGLHQPWHFFWMTGGLSSFLDNAPTYLVFFETANAMTHSPGEGILKLLDGHFIREDLLVAISLGAVFMGANTYIGNGPNFMVKSIAEQSGIKMPSFGGYMIRYSIPVLIPLFIVVSLLFMRSHGQ